MEKKIIYIPEYMYILIASEKYEGQNISTFSYSEGITYSSIHKIYNEFIELGFFENIKREIKLTEKGKDVIKQIKILFDLFEIKDKNFYRIRRKRNQYNELSFTSEKDKIEFNKLSKKDKDEILKQYLEGKNNGRN